MYLTAEQAAGPLFETIAQEWWYQYERHIKKGTAKGYRANYRRALDFFSGKRMLGITATDVNCYILRMSAQGYAQSSIANTRKRFKWGYRYLVKTGEFFSRSVLHFYNFKVML